MAMVPLQATWRDDFVVQLVPVDDGDKMSAVAAAVAAHAVNLRVPAEDRPMGVWLNGERLDDDKTVAEVGIEPMDYIEAGYV
jgi:toluene monooxygenase system protein B